MKWPSYFVLSTVYIIVGVVVWLITFRIVMNNNEEEYSFDPADDMAARVSLAALYAAEMALFWPIVLAAGIVATMFAAGMYIDEYIWHLLETAY